MDTAVDSSSAAAAADTSAEPAGTAGATPAGLPAAASSPISEPAEEDAHTEPSSSTPVAVVVPAPVTATNATAPSKGNELPQSYLPSYPGPPVWSQSNLVLDVEDEAEREVFPLAEPKHLDPEWSKGGVPDTKFHKDYPPDPWGQEAAPNARVWRIYRDEMATADADKLKSWNDTIDVLLIFAGLFSAVSTAFVIESYKNLQPDYTQYIANVLYATATSNRTADSIINLLNVGSLGAPDGYVQPSSGQRWTNGLWFSSLVVSLTVALLCILIKQWLDQYQLRTKRSAPSPMAWARRHRIYYDGLSSWGVPMLISFLPLLLHVSLFLFFAGLVLFLWPLDGAVAFTLLVILVLTLLFYALSLVLPAFYANCPSYTPLLAQARSLITFILEFLSSFRVAQDANLVPAGSMIARIKRAISTARLMSSSQSFARETSTIDKQQHILDGRALNALLRLTNDSDVIDAGVEAISAVAAEATLDIVVREGPLDIIDERTCREFLPAGDAPSAFSVLSYARRARTYCALAVKRSQAPRPSGIADLDLFLGLEGVMLHTMMFSVADGILVKERLLRRLLTYVTHMLEARGDDPSSPAGARYGHSPPGLNRTTCRLFLRVVRFYPMLAAEFHAPIVLLAFCAGNFAHAEPRERALAIRSLLAFLEHAIGVETPTKYSPAVNADDAARGALDRVFELLAVYEIFVIHPNTRGPVLHHLGLLYKSLHQRYSQVPWENLSGFAALTQSYSFNKNISRVGLNAYIDVLQRAAMPGDEDAELSQQYWTSVALLLKLQLDLTQGLDDILGSRMERFLAHPRRMIIAFCGASDDVLINFLWAANALDSRVKSSADALSCLLCHRLRIQPLADGLVQWLFAGTFLTNQIRTSLAGIEWLLQPEDVGQRIMTLVRHCARLAASSPIWSSGSVSALPETGSRPLDPMLRICDELENTSNVEDGLEDDALALVAEIRRGLEPGGELRAECDPSCPCWPQAKPQPPSEPTSRTTRWRERIFGRISGAPDSAV